MAAQTAGVSIAFLAGLVSFLSPCVLPIIPGFLSYLAGNSQKRNIIFLHSLAFVAGFSAVFALLGVLLNTLLEAIAYDVQLWLGRIGGIIIFFFGLYLLGLFHIPLLERQFRFRITRSVGPPLFTSALFGAAFAAGWTPCVGAVLGSILGLAASAPGSAFLLLISYSLGFGVPFLIVGLFTQQASGFIYRNARVFAYATKGFGVVLIVLGILIFFQLLSRLANFELLLRLTGQ